MNNVIVTAYFDIGRKDFVAIPRTNNQYIDYFKFWARIRNEMIIYTQPEFADTIFSIRKEYGLEKKTKIISVENIYDIDRDLYERMKIASSNDYFLGSRILPNATSNNAEYSYLMLLKSYFMEEASKLCPANSFISWVDFGFNHLTGIHKRSEDFDFEWLPSVPESKITVFSLKEYDDKPIFEIVRTLEDYMIGTVIICPNEYCKILRKKYWDAMSVLLKVGLIDDDQLILLMAYISDKSIFNYVICDWNEQFIKTTDINFSINKKKTPSWFRTIVIRYHKFKKYRKVLKRSNRINKIRIRSLYK